MVHVGCLTKYVEIEDVEIDIDIDMNDMTSLIDDADTSQRNKLLNYILKSTRKGQGMYIVSDTLESDMKEEWWQEAKAKYSLVQLEEILGNKFDLM